LITQLIKHAVQNHTKYMLQNKVTQWSKKLSKSTLDHSTYQTCCRESCKVQQWFYWRFRVMTTTGTTTTTVTGETQKCRQEQKESVWMEKEEN